MAPPVRALSRRDFLKLSGAALAGVAWQPQPPEPPETPVGVGRTIQMLRLYAAPDFGSAELGLVAGDSVLSLFEVQTARTARPGTEHNRVWYRVKAGWLHSAFVQPVAVALNAPLGPEAIPPGGFLAEVTVPFTQAWHLNGRLAYRFYYSQTHWVDQVSVDADGQAWYRVLDDRYVVPYLVRAEHLRRVPPEELAPVAPEVADKRIEIDLHQQRLAAYENGQEVLTARIASGLPSTPTPTGELHVLWKRPSRHMAATGRNGFDLPGVPWVTYFHANGSALHGAYWHNDFGRPRSHGCVNLPPEAARWLYRWTLPVVPPDQVQVREAGTPVVVF